MLPFYMFNVAVFYGRYLEKEMLYMSCGRLWQYI